MGCKSGMGGDFSLVRKRIGMDKLYGLNSFLNRVFSPSSEGRRTLTHQRPSIDNQLPLLSYQPSHYDFIAGLLKNLC